MLDNISTNNVNSQSDRKQKQSTILNCQTTIDFDSILQELKSVGQAHQQTDTIVENITTNIKQKQQIDQIINSTETSKIFN